MIRWLKRLFGFSRDPQSIPIMGGDLPAMVPAEEPGPKGLQRAWDAGERLPWKGIWFRVQTVGEDSLVLVPESMTFKRTKEVKAAKTARSRR